MIRSERIVERVEQLVGELVYPWHTNLVRKSAQSNAAITWHIDWGSWYGDGLLEPLFSSCVVALTATTINNGCLHFMRDSHRTGRRDRVKDEHEGFNIPRQRLATMLECYKSHVLEMQRAFPGQCGTSSSACLR